MTLGGDFIEVRVSHPTLGDHTFYPKSNEGNTFDPGGVRAVDDANMITGNGAETIDQLNRVRSSFEIVCANDMNEREDAQFAASLGGDPVPGQWTVSHISGVTYGLTGRPVGDIQVDTNAGTFTLKVAGTVAQRLV
jgi:hypothetical protein